MLGREPVVRFTGLLENTLPTSRSRTSSRLREALTEIARHAHARSAEIDTATDAARLTLDVRDDGVGITPMARWSGLANMRRRAERHAGTLTVESRDPTGTRISWSVPL